MGIEEEVKKVKSVTRLDIQRAYNKYFKLENMTLNMIGKGLSTQTDEYKKLVTQYFN
jgi:predicted Zn-dependent peptidase